MTGQAEEASVGSELAAGEIRAGPGVVVIGQQQVDAADDGEEVVDLDGEIEDAEGGEGEVDLDDDLDEEYDEQIIEEDEDEEEEEAEEGVEEEEEERGNPGESHDCTLSLTAEA